MDSKDYNHIAKQMEEKKEIICSTESKPLLTLEELLNWIPLNECQANQKPYKINALKAHKKQSKSKTLLCHDMKGGYTEDRFNDGCADHNSYRFFHWSLIDIFVYFSHCFITIPPIGWINAGHINGVPILGTIIVEEWNEVMSTVLKRMLSSTEMVEKVCTQMLEIAKYYSFDGWLINIESTVQTDSIDNLILFVKLLTEKMHSHDPNSLVIWYDSVTTPDGLLKWQNELNCANKPFFDNCDGIFLNYTWNDSNLTQSYQISQNQLRNYDVFVGIDVFGRNCFGGGGMNCNLALNKILESKLSSAIFAPAWTHEVLGPDQFTTNEYEFWSKLDLAVNHIPQKLPLITHFCQGFGKGLYKNGKLIDSNPWFNLNLQQLQPSVHKDIEVYLNDAYKGGGCIIMKSEHVQLFKCDFKIGKNILAVTYKIESNLKLTTILNCQMTSSSGEETKLAIGLNTVNTDEFGDQVISIENVSTESVSVSQHLNNILYKTNTGWVTDCFILENKKVDRAVTVNSIDLRCDSCGESSDTNKPLIGQLVVTNIFT